MVSLRCKLLVKSLLNDLAIEFNTIELGKIHLVKPLSWKNKELLKVELHRYGLEFIDDKNTILIERIITIIVEMVHYSDEYPAINFSNYLSEKMHLDYHKMAELFSKTKGMTIEHFIIIHKIEKIKELIIYDELNLTEISYKMHYSSVAHLSKQFKQITGLTPSFFKSMSKQTRINIEDL